MDPSKLTWERLLVLAILLGVLIMATGLLLLWARHSQGSREATPSIVRSWIALNLVTSLVILTAFSLALPDEDVRNLLIGGLVASVGAAVAYYFSSKDADSARRDVLDAVFGEVDVPDLSALTEAAAKSVVAVTSLQLVATGGSTHAGRVVATQTPPGGTSARRGSTIKVTYRDP
jgi:hypothetical protein